MEKIATDIYTFGELRKKGFTYVDKTDVLWPLANESIGKQFFLARPRRFGKSLLISTLRSLFEGKRDLFQGLAIKPKWDWSQTWPVIHLDLGSCQADTVEALYDGDVEKFVKALRSFFANIPYDLTDRQNEQMWQAIVYVVLKLIGTAVTAEVKTNDGRIDMVCDAPSGIYLIEFKLDRSAEEALEQIDRNDCAAKYDLAGKKVVKIGVSFSSEKRTITDVQVRV